MGGRDGKVDALRALRIGLILSLGLLLASCSSNTSSTASREVDAAPAIPDAVPETVDERFSYVFGYQMGLAMDENVMGIEPSVVAQGLLDYIEGTGLYSDEEMTQILSEFQDKVFQRAEELYRSTVAGNLDAAEAFLASNANRTGVVSLSDQIQYEVLQSGSHDGRRALASSTVTVDYQCIDLDGNIVDSTFGSQPVQLSLPDTISGFSAVVSQMSEGERVRAWIHPSQAYGSYGSGNIGPNELLIFDIDLVSVDG